MGRLVVIEGLDGSGKRTFTAALRRAIGSGVRTMTFPRYGQSVFADLASDVLYGRLGDLTDSVHGSALMFALDRRDAAAGIREAVQSCEILLIDRYVSSNAAYGSARLGGGGDAEWPAVARDFPEWIRRLEIERFGVPAPDLQILLDTPPAMAAERAQQRAAGDATRALDTFESDAGLQLRTQQVYRELATGGYLSPWRVVVPGSHGTAEPDAVIAALTG